MELKPNARAQRLYRLHAVQIPLMRASAHALLTLLVALHMYALDGRVNLRSVLQFAIAAIVYCTATWLALHVHHSRPRDRHDATLGFALTILDPIMIAIAVYLTGAARSWLFVLLIVPVASQAYLSGRRASLVSISAIVSYLGVLLYAHRFDGLTIEWPLAWVKIGIVVGAAIYCIWVGAIEERYRSTMIRALRDAKREAEAHVAELASLNRVTRTAAGTLDVNQMLDEITREVVDLFRAADGKIILGEWREQADERTIVAPLRSHGNSIGAMVIHAGKRLRPPFTSQDRQLAETIAGQIAGPVANARLFVEEKQSRELAERLHKIAGAMAESLDLQTVLSEILRLLAQLIEFDTGTVQLIEGDAMRVLAVWNLPESEVGRLRPLEAFPYMAKLARGTSPVILSVTNAKAVHEADQLPELKSVLGVPLVLREQTLGALSIESTRRRAYSESDARAVQAFAHHAAIALDHARIYGTVHEASVRDPLTGVANRRKFEEALTAEWERALRERTPVAALMIDVDAFKAYNDRYGHQRGDEVLRRVADQLRSLANGFLVARYGGEEFVVMACADHSEASSLAEALRASVEALAVPHDGSPAGILTISVGVASAVPEGESPAVLVAQADARLYEAKRAGRNRVV